MSPVVMRTCRLEAPHQLHCNGRGCHPAYGTDCAHLCPDAQLLGFCCLLCCIQLLVVGALLAAAGPDLHQPGHTLCFSYFYRFGSVQKCCAYQQAEWHSQNPDSHRRTSDHCRAEEMGIRPRNTPHMLRRLPVPSQRRPPSRQGSRADHQ